MTPGDYFIPHQINTGTLVTAYSHAELNHRIQGARVVLPICSIGTSPERLGGLGSLVLPPLYHEALTSDVKVHIVERIRQCFPYHEATRARAAWRGRLDVVELPRTPLPAHQAKPRIAAFSVDTAVEQHGPHLPLATDTLQSYAVLHTLATEFDGFVVAPPIDYGQLTWGLPFGLSIDLTAPLIARYVTGFANAIVDWLAPDALYVVDVHGSAIHRNAVQNGLTASRCRTHAFRWLHEALTEFSSDRGDMHAGGVETALIHHINPGLVDPRWWPGRLGELAAGQLSVKAAVELSSDLGRFIQHVESRPLNGIVGDIRNAFDLDAPSLMDRMLRAARADVRSLLEARPR